MRRRYQRTFRNLDRMSESPTSPMSPSRPGLRARQRQGHPRELAGVRTNCFDDRKATEMDRRRPLHHHARPGPTLADHRDYRPGWNETIDDPKTRSNTYEDYKRRTTIYQERKAELDAFYDRFDLEEIDGGERWRCKTCGAHGETWKPMPGLYDYPHAIGTAAHRHPTCERTSA